jgi:hypothetical protein
MVFVGMKRRDRVQHVKMLDTEWEYWNQMNEEQLRKVLIQKTKADDKAKLKIQRYDKADLIRKLVVRHIGEMV